MKFVPVQRSSKGLALVLGTIAMTFGMVGAASAEDGIQNLFSSIFGGGQPQPVVARPVEPSETMPQRTYSRPLTVKLHRPKVQRFAMVPTKPGKVSIFEDKTLKRGDAVMTQHGMRIFAGSNTWPYSDGDFVAITDAGRMDRGVQKMLISLDSLPRR